MQGSEQDWGKDRARALYLVRLAELDESAEYLGSEKKGPRSIRSLFHMLWMRPVHAAGMHKVPQQFSWAQLLLWYSIISAIYFGIFVGCLKYADYFSLGAVGSAIIWFPPAGINLAFSLWMGPAAFPVLWGAEVLAAIVLIPNGLSPGANVLWSFFKALLYVIEGSVLLCIDPRLQLSHPLKVLRFLVITIVSHFIIGSVFAIFIVVVYPLSPFQYWQLISGWVLGDISAIYTITVLIIIARERTRFFILNPAAFRDGLSRKLVISLLAVLVVAGIALWLMFWPQSVSGPRSFLLLAPLILCSFFFGVFGVSFLMLILFIIVVAVVFFVPAILGVTDPLELQFSLCVFCIFALFLGSEHNTRIRYQLLEKRGEQRNKLLEIVAHDIKTPLHVI